MKRKIIFFILLFIGCLNFLFAQTGVPTESYHNFGLFSNYHYIINQADFANLPGITLCCPHFKTNNGSGYTLGGLYDYMFGKYGVEISAGYNSFIGKFNASVIKKRKVDQQTIEVPYEYNIDFNLNSFTITTEVKVLLFERLSISAGLGLSFNNNSNFTETEQFVDLKGRVIFPDTSIEVKGRFVQKEISGSIPNLNNIQFLAGAKIGYDLQVTNNRNIIFRPEFGVNYVFTPMISNLSWNMLILKLGFSLYYSTISSASSNSEAVEKKEIEKLEKLNNEYKLKSSENQQLTENIKLLKEEREKCERLLFEKDSLLKQDIQTTTFEKSKIEVERQEMNKAIDEENKLTGRKCSCFIILFLSTTDKDVAKKLFSDLISNSVKYVTISQFTDPYLNDKYYRVQSKCYDNHNDAFDDKIKIRTVINKLNLSPQIKCDK